MGFRAEDAVHDAIGAGGDGHDEAVGDQAFLNQSHPIVGLADAKRRFVVEGALQATIVAVGLGLQILGLFRLAQALEMRRPAAPGLLQHMGQFMGDQMPAFAAARLVGTGAKGDILAQGKGPGPHGLGRRRRVAAVVQPHRTEIGPEARLEVTAQCVGQRPARARCDPADKPRRVGETAAGRPGPVCPASALRPVPPSARLV